MGRESKNRGKRERVINKQTDNKEGRKVKEKGRMRSRVDFTNMFMHLAFTCPDPKAQKRQSSH